MTDRKYLFAALLLVAGSSSSCTQVNAGRNELPTGNIDRPAENAVLHNPTVFAGWGAHPSGIQAVGIYVDGQYLAKADLDAKRPDVRKARPQYTDSMIAGWDAVVNLEGITPGRHVFTVKLRSNSGEQRDYTVKETVAQ